MLDSEVKKNSRGKTQKNFFLTQGDSATIYSTPKHNGSVIDISLVSKCVFKLSLDDYKQKFAKELDLQGDKYVLTLTSEDTNGLEITTYIYEFEYTFVDGSVNTPNMGEFTITEQIVKSN